MSGHIELRGPLQIVSSTLLAFFHLPLPTDRQTDLRCKNVFPFPVPYSLHSTSVLNVSLAACRAFRRRTDLAVQTAELLRPSRESESRMKERERDIFITVFALDDERRAAKEGTAPAASLMLIALSTMLWGMETRRRREGAGGTRGRSASGNLVSSPDNGNKPHTTTTLPRTRSLAEEGGRGRRDPPGPPGPVDHFECPLFLSRSDPP